MCYLCLSDQFIIEVPTNKTKRNKERALEIKKLLKAAEESLACNDGNKIIESLKEEQYKLSREI